MNQATPENGNAPSKRNPVGWTITLAAALGLIGLAVESLLGYGPWRDLFWREAWMNPLIDAFGLSWGEYLRHPWTNPALRTVEISVGLVYASASILCLIARPRWLVTTALIVGVGLISIDAWFSYLGHGHRVFQLFEYALRWFAPLGMIGVLFGVQQSRGMQWAMRLTIALTFAGHGLWAMGVSFTFGPVELHYPTPGLWVDMVLQVLPMIEESTARALLRLAGILDWAVAIGLLLPRRFAWPALGWAIIWGGLTTAARIVANADAFALSEAAAFWLSEALRRIPHLGIPIALWLLLQRPSGQSAAEVTDHAEHPDTSEPWNGTARA